MTSPWTYLALKMKVGDSVQLDRYEHVLKLKYALLRLGFAFVRRKFSDDCWRVWKQKRKVAEAQKSHNSQRVYFAKRSQIVTGQIVLPKRRGETMRAIILISIFLWCLIFKAMAALASHQQSEDQYRFISFLSITPTLDRK